MQFAKTSLLGFFIFQMVLWPFSGAACESYINLLVFSKHLKWPRPEPLLRWISLHSSRGQIVLYCIQVFILFIYLFIDPMDCHLPGQRDCCPSSEGVHSVNRDHLALARWFPSNQLPPPHSPPPPLPLHQRSLHPADPVLNYFHPNSQSTIHQQHHHMPHGSHTTSHDNISIYITILVKHTLNSPFSAFLPVCLSQSVCGYLFISVLLRCPSVTRYPPFSNSPWSCDNDSEF